MPTLTMVESQAVAELAESLYDFLPASFSAITWPEVAQRCGVRDCWPDGSSKRQSIPIFLRNVLEHGRGNFCDMIVAVVQEGINYKSRKGNSVTREEVEKINQSLLKVQFKIPQLNDRRFLDGLPLAAKEPDASVQQPTMATSAEIEKLRLRFISLFAESDTQKRGLGV